MTRRHPRCRLPRLSGEAVPLRHDKAAYGAGPTGRSCRAAPGGTLPCGRHGRVEAISRPVDRQQAVRPDRQRRRLFRVSLAGHRQDEDGRSLAVAAPVAGS
ncbi:hypothetical protein GCM10009863_39200 [Streptomyces axinellae]|uniref:Uncharacterized protein n=1 Tax=Streptomyces axinellae TaxID=552788 RepID=A0ABP6CIN8_9ACTN